MSGAPAFDAPSEPASSAVNAGGENADWELVTTIATGNPHSDLRAFMDTNSPDGFELLFLRRERGHPDAAVGCPTQQPLVHQLGKRGAQRLAADPERLRDLHAHADRLAALAGEQEGCGHGCRAPRR